MTRAMMLALACLALACSDASADNPAPVVGHPATVGYLDDQGNIFKVVDEISEFAPEPETPDEDVPTFENGSKKARIAKVHMAKRKTSRAYGEYTSGYRNRRILSATLESTWHRDRWRISEPVGRIYTHFIDQAPGVFWKFDRWSPVEEYPYQYKGHGMGSGYVLHVIAYFKLCWVVKPLCAMSREIDLRLNLHADGSFKRIVHVR